MPFKSNPEDKPKTKHTLMVAAALDRRSASMEDCFLPSAVQLPSGCSSGKEFLDAALLFHIDIRHTCTYSWELVRKVKSIMGMKNSFVFAEKGGEILPVHLPRPVI